MICQTFVIGFNHHHADAAIRGRWSLSSDLQHDFYHKAKERGLNTLCILNTCNRTEVYGFGDVSIARSIYTELLGANAGDTSHLTQKTGDHALEHIFKVASGLDSQVVGDLEILGQFKQAFHSAKKYNTLNGYFERLANSSIQAAKEIRSSTRISSGTVSLAYAAVRYIKDNRPGQPLRVLVLGLGDFGKSIALNVRDYLPEASLMLCNRTRAKAEPLAASIGAELYDFADLPRAVEAADVVVSSVNADMGFILTAQHITDKRSRLFLDMSVPLSIDPALEEINQNRIAGLDEVSRVINETLEARKGDIPRAEEILNRRISEFRKWVSVFEKSESLQQWKSLMHRMSELCPHMNKLDDTQKNRIIGKSMSDFVSFLRQREELPAETETIIAHFLSESEKVLICRHTGLPMTREEKDNCKACAGDPGHAECDHPAACPGS